MCTTCGADCEGESPHPICGCGIRIQGRISRYRCIRNPHRTADNPAEIVVAFGGEPVKPEGL